MILLLSRVVIVSIIKFFKVRIEGCLVASIVVRTSAWSVAWRISCAGAVVSSVGGVVWHDVRVARVARVQRRNNNCECIV